MKHSKNLIKTFLKFPKIQKLTKYDKVKIKGGNDDSSSSDIENGIVDEDLENI